MDIDQATIVDARSASLNEFHTMILEARTQASRRGANHLLIWLIQPWQRQELECALRAAPPTANEQIIILEGNDNAREIADVTVATIRPAWEGILRLLSQWVSPKANEIVCNILKEQLKSGKLLTWNEMTRKGIVKQLDREFRAEEIFGYHDAMGKAAQRFFKRLISAGELLNQPSKPTNPEDPGTAIASVDLQFRELLLEWVVLSIIRGDPIHFGNNDPSSVKRLEAAIDRLLIKRRIIEDSEGKLRYRWPPRFDSGKAA